MDVLTWEGEMVWGEWPFEADEVCPDMDQGWVEEDGGFVTADQNYVRMEGMGWCFDTSAW